MADGFDIDLNDLDNSYNQSKWDSIKQSVSSFFGMFKSNKGAWKISEKKINDFYSQNSNLKPSDSNLNRLIYAIHNPNDKNLEDFAFDSIQSMEKIDAYFRFFDSHGIAPLEGDSNTRIYSLNGQSYLIDFDREILVKTQEDPKLIMNYFSELNVIEKDERTHAHQNLLSSIQEKYDIETDLENYFKIHQDRLEQRDIDSALIGVCEIFEEDNTQILNEDNLIQTVGFMNSSFNKAYTHAIEFADEKESLIDILINAQLDSLNNRTQIIQNQKTYQTNNDAKYYCLSNVKIGTPLGSLPLHSIDGVNYIVKYKNDLLSFGAHEVSTRNSKNKQRRNDSRKIRLKREIVLSDSKDIVLYSENAKRKVSLRTIELDLKNKIEADRKLMDTDYSSIQMGKLRDENAMLNWLSDSQIKAKQSAGQSIELTDDEYNQRLKRSSARTKRPIIMTNVTLDTLLDSYKQTVSRSANISSTHVEQLISRYFERSPQVSIESDLNSFEIKARKSKADLVYNPEEAEITVEPLTDN